MNPCQHEQREIYSGDLICSTCGKVIQKNCELAEESSVFEILQDSRNANKLASIPVQLARNLTHEARSELQLHRLATNIISAFALKATYEDEAFRLMKSHWSTNSSKFKYGNAGNKLLVAALYLLARRDRLAVNLSSLADSIQCTSFECGQYFSALVQLDPTLRVLAEASSFAEHEVVHMTDIFNSKYGLVIVESKIHDLVRQVSKISSLLHQSETGSSKSSQATAVAASWICFDALFNSDQSMFKTFIKSKSCELVIKDVCEEYSISYRTLTSKRNQLIDSLVSLALTSLPSTFNPLPDTKPLRYALLLSCLDEVLIFVQNDRMLK